MEEYNSTKDTQNHITKVRQNIAVLFEEISKRHERHDASKLIDPEKATFDRVTPALKGLTYGSAEYTTMLTEMKPALDHHYAANRHHPENHTDGVLGMNLVDLLEMFCDWCAATERHDDGDIGKSIEHNMKRFGYGETLASIMVNTAQDFGMGKRSHVAYRPIKPGSK